MLRLALIVSITILIGSCTAQNKAQRVLNQTTPLGSSGSKSLTDSPRIDGIYEFVSRTTTITRPRESTEKLAAPEWYGLWIFHDGYFSQTRMKNIRPDWTPAQFPSNPQGLGFDGSSGTYVIKGDILELDYMVNFYPGRIGANEDLKYRFDNDTLTLIWEMLPGREFGSTGQRVTVLRRVK